MNSKDSLLAGISVGIVSVISVTILMMAGTIPAANAAFKNTKWVEVSRGKVVDMDPFAADNSVGLLIELDNGSWHWMWRHSMEGNYPSRGNYGVLYKRTVDKKEKYKWTTITDGKKRVDSKKQTKSKDKKVLPIAFKISAWQSISTGTPPANKTVLVRYSNGKTITTAYINGKEQWKLETDRGRVSDGKTITTIKEWKEIPE